ncbi:Major outer membrane protein P.IB [Pandoraea iniqua]|uniref:porin n=1 Tax=Pandoraea iniqua TaxID=2508288 RepID=UPI001252E3B8|nr:porin [Pandoraea iniqua]VVE11730.1 Major outer membrane protein P.IB [Pandoraea iniqua]
MAGHAGARVLGVVLGMSVYEMSHAQVQIYGLLTPMTDGVSVSGRHVPAGTPRPTQAPAGAINVGEATSTRMMSSISYFGMRGKEDLGDGYSAIWQIETPVAIDGKAAGVSIAGRNTNVGLAGPFGTAFLGNWDTPYQWSTLSVGSPVRNPYTGDLSTILSNPGFNVPNTTTQSGRVNGAADATFNRRQGNSIQYWTPDWAGLHLRFSYSPSQGKVATPAGDISPQVFGAGLEYLNGPLRVRYAYELHKDYFGLAWLGAPASGNPSNAGSRATGSTDDAHKVLITFTYAGTKWVAGWDRLTYRTDDGTIGNLNRYRRDAVYAMVQHWFGGGQHSVWIGGGYAMDGACSRSGGGACSTDGLGATQMNLGYRYDFSRRTDVYVAYYQVINRAWGSYGFSPRPISGNGGNAPPGTHYRGIGVGIEHSF